MFSTWLFFLVVHILCSYYDCKLPSSTLPLSGCLKMLKQESTEHMVTLSTTKPTEDCSATSTAEKTAESETSRATNISESTSFLPADSDPAQFELDHVHSVYDVIAQHFSNTRHTPWPKVGEFLLSLESGSVVADVGCGNGKYFAINPSLFMLASDRSPALANLAARRMLEQGALGDVCVCDNLQLPYRDGSVDAVLSIAVLHHLANEERRLAALRELIRVLRPRGKALVYVWAMEQQGRRGRFSSQDQLIAWHLQNKYRADPSRGADGAPPPAGVDVPEKHSVQYRRFYHLFVEGELEGLVARAGRARVVTSYFDHENWCAVIERSE